MRKEVMIVGGVLLALGIIIVVFRNLTAHEITAGRVGGRIGGLIGILLVAIGIVVLVIGLVTKTSGSGQSGNSFRMGY